MEGFIWYHGSASRSAAEDQFFGPSAVDGAFLVRNCTDDGGLILTVYQRGVITHHNIAVTSAGSRKLFGFLVAGAKSAIRVASVAELIELYEDSRMGPPVIDAAHVRPTVIDAARPARPLNPFAEPHSKNKNNPFEEDSKVSTLAAPAAVRPFQATRQTFDLGSAAVGSAVGSSLDSESQNQPIQNGPGLRLPAFDSAESAMAAMEASMTGGYQEPYGLLPPQTSLANPFGSPPTRDDQSNAIAAETGIIDDRGSQRRNPFNDQSDIGVGSAGSPAVEAVVLSLKPTLSGLRWGDDDIAGSPTSSGQFNAVAKAAAAAVNESREKLLCEGPLLKLRGTLQNRQRWFVLTSRKLAYYKENAGALIASVQRSTITSVTQVGERRIKIVTSAPFGTSGAYEMVLEAATKQALSKWTSAMKDGTRRATVGFSSDRAELIIEGPILKLQPFGTASMKRWFRATTKKFAYLSADGGDELGSVPYEHVAEVRKLGDKVFSLKSVQPFTRTGRFQVICKFDNAAVMNKWITALCRLLPSDKLFMGLDERTP